MISIDGSFRYSLIKFLIITFSVKVKKFYVYSSYNNIEILGKKNKIKRRLLVLLILYLFSLSIIFKGVIILRLQFNKNHIRKLAEIEVDANCCESNLNNVRVSCHSPLRKYIDERVKMRKWSKVKKRTLKWIKNSYCENWTEQDLFRYNLHWKRCEATMRDIIKCLSSNQQKRIIKDLNEMNAKWEERLNEKDNKQNSEHK
ncbi:Plasmodium exported protein, unknown function [Plasmodium gallinaceum]|uniref:Uncharacterized protein n=1 Tax=Plasmodium gallinaceum TaxID=5849 RepID=A0A1J1GZW2_PLAGA|nr:Plasmodium exported protein, unknown function [Plasmodium gallinaceum]CRG97996.1 Plasmodium exported protein, unknown function [Plasmodium gallinaceum]